MEERTNAREEHTGVNEALAVSRDIGLFSDGLLEVSDGFVSSNGDLELELVGTWGRVRRIVVESEREERRDL